MLLRDDRRHRRADDPSAVDAAYHGGQGISCWYLSGCPHPREYSFAGQQTRPHNDDVPGACASSEKPPRSSRRRLILASASPRRAQLLREAGYEFTIIAPSLDEPNVHETSLKPAALAEAISYYKARCVSAAVSDAVILAADTIVSAGRQIFGKPADRADAKRILTALAGTIHEVITGVTVLPSDSPIDRIITHEVTRVRMRPLSEIELERYLDSGDWQGKAGAFGIQDTDDPFVECVEGSFTNVVGLPMERVSDLLKYFGLEPV